MNIEFRIYRSLGDWSTLQRGKGQAVWSKRERLSAPYCGFWAKGKIMIEEINLEGNKVKSFLLGHHYSLMCKGIE